MKRSMKDEVGSRKYDSPRSARHSGALRPTSAFSLQPSAFSLVEVVIAVGIFSFVIVAVMGTMSVALSSTRDSEMKLSAAHTSAVIIGTLKANPTNITDTNFTISSVTSLATLTGTKNSPTNVFVDRQGRYVGSDKTATNAAFRLAWKLTKDTTLTNLVFCNIELAWPPGAPTNSVSSHRVATSILLP